MSIYQYILFKLKEYNIIIFNSKDIIREIIRIMKYTDFFDDFRHYNIDNDINSNLSIKYIHKSITNLEVEYIDELLNKHIVNNIHICYKDKTIIL